MRRHTAAWFAWSLCAVCLALIGLALLLDFLTGEVIPEGVPGERPGPAFAVLTGVLSLAFPTVGALIASRLPTNPIGWVFCGMGLLYTAGRFSSAYADYALVENFAFPWWGVRGLVHFVRMVCDPDSGSIPDPVVP